MIMVKVARNSAIIRRLVSIKIDGANISTDSYKLVTIFMINVVRIMTRVSIFIYIYIYWKILIL